MPEVPATILGGLPVIAAVRFGVDDGPNGRDYWAEVEQIYWRKRDGSKGKPIPQHIFDRAEEADPCFGALVEEANDYLAGLPSDEKVQLL